MEYYEKRYKGDINIACKFVKPVPGLRIIITPNEFSDVTLFAS